MIVASFNVNGIRARLEILLNWLATAKPDVVCLQETKVQDADFPVAALNEAGYQVAYHGQKSYNGVAILSRQGLEDVRLGFSDGSHPDDARLITARVETLGSSIRNVPQGQAVDRKSSLTSSTGCARCGANWIGAGSPTSRWCGWVT